MPDPERADDAPDGAGVFVLPIDDDGPGVGSPGSGISSIDLSMRA